LNLNQQTTLLPVFVNRPLPDRMEENFVLSIVNAPSDNGTIRITQI
jgi:hypothetical protein